MNYLALVQRLYRETGQSGSPPTTIVNAQTKDLRLFDWVADVWRNLQSEGRFQWKWMQEKIDNPINTIDTAYTGASLGASNFGRWMRESEYYRVRAYDPANPGNVWPLKFVEYEKFERDYMDIAYAPSAPQVWSISPTEELLINQADQVYNLKATYLTEPTELIADADEPNMPNRHHLVVMWGALQMAAMFDAAQETLARANAMYESMHSQLVLDQGEEIRSRAYPLA